MLTLRQDPAIEGAAEDAPPPGWTVLSDGRCVGRAWRSRHGNTYTLHINGVSIVEASVEDALARAQRHFGDDPAWTDSSVGALLDGDVPATDLHQWRISLGTAEACAGRLLTERRSGWPTLVHAPNGLPLRVRRTDERCDCTYTTITEG